MTDMAQLVVLILFAAIGLWVAFLFLCMFAVALYDRWGKPKGWRRWGR